MLRCRSLPVDFAASSRRWCAAAPAASATSAGWKRLPLYHWQSRRLLDHDTSALGTSEWARQVRGQQADPRLRFLGDRLGPRPLVLLPSFSDLGEYQSALEASKHAHGVVCLQYGVTAQQAASAIVNARASRAVDAKAAISQLPVAPAHLGLDYVADGFITEYCHSLAAALHCLDCTWVHVLGHSFGGLVAAKLALLYPRLVGTITLIDTPVATRFDVTGEDAREEVFRMRMDVNTPRAQIDAAVASLRQRTDEGAPLSCPSPIDKPLYEALFDRTSYSDDGCSRDSSSWLSVPHLRMIRVPVHYILPPKPEGAKKNDSNSNDATRDVLSVRKATHIKSAAAGTLTAEAAAEVGQQIAAWVARFDMDSVVERQWVRAKEDILKSQSARGAAAPAPSTDTKDGKDAKRGTKKEKKAGKK